MAENTKIEWTDATWQPITGCSVGISARVGKLRAAGNAIVPQVAAAFIGEVMAELNIAPVTTPSTQVREDR